MTDRKLGFVGLGRMGGPMSGRLIDAGYDLTVYDTNRSAVDAAVARGARAAGSPREVADAVPVVLTSLPTPDVVEKVALGPDGLAGGHRAIGFLERLVERRIERAAGFPRI